MALTVALTVPANSVKLCTTRTLFDVIANAFSCSIMTSPVTPTAATCTLLRSIDQRGFVSFNQRGNLLRTFLQSCTELKLERLLFDLRLLNSCHMCRLMLQCFLHFNCESESLSDFSLLQYNNSEIWFIQ